MIRITLQYVKTAWHALTMLKFIIEANETEPQLLRILAPNEAVVAVSMEVRIGDNSGMMNIGIPSIVIKMLRSKFDQQWSIRKSESTEKEQAQVLRLVSTAKMQLDGRLDGPTIRIEDLMDIQDDDVLMLDYPVDRLGDLTVNGKLKYRGRMVATGRKRAFQIEEMHTAG